MPHRRSLGAVAGDDGHVDVARAVLLVADVAFFLEDAQQRRRILHSRADDVVAAVLMPLSSGMVIWGASRVEGRVRRRER